MHATQHSRQPPARAPDVEVRGGQDSGRGPADERRDGPAEQDECQGGRQAWQDEEDSMAHFPHRVQDDVAPFLLHRYLHRAERLGFSVSKAKATPSRASAALGENPAWVSSTNAATRPR